MFVKISKKFFFITAFQIAKIKNNTTQKRWIDAIVRVNQNTAVTLYSDSIIRIFEYEMIIKFVRFFEIFYQNSIKKMLHLFKKMHKIVAIMKRNQNSKFIANWKQITKIFNDKIKRIEKWKSRIVKKLLNSSLRALFFFDSFVFYFNCHL